MRIAPLFALLLLSTGCAEGATSTSPPRIAPTPPIEPEPAAVADSQSRAVQWDIKVIYPDTEQKEFTAIGAADIPLPGSRWRCRHEAPDRQARFEGLAVECVDVSGARVDVEASCATGIEYFNSVPLVLHENDPGATHTILLHCKNF